jgi:hypothetical protein
MVGLYKGLSFFSGKRFSIQPGNFYHFTRILYLYSFICVSKQKSGYMKAIFNGKSGRWFTASMIMLMLAAAVAGFYNIENSNLDEELKAERLHAESLFSNKVVLQKELEGLRREIIRLEFEGKPPGQKLTG